MQESQSQNEANVELAIATAEQQGAPALEPQAAPPRYTAKQMGAMRRQFMTITHGTVRMCGHKINLSKQPNNNCSACWYAYFKTVDGLLVTLHETLVTKGLPALKAQYGDKLVKQFARFLDAELANDKEQETNAVSQEGEGSTCAEAGCGCAGVGSGEVQSTVCSIEPAGQEARNDEQSDSVGQETEPSNTGSADEPTVAGQ